MREEAEIERRMFLRTVRTWSHKPHFQMEQRLDTGRRRGSVKVWTTDQVYGWIDEGTKAHYVPKSGVATMMFPSRSRPKTKVRTIGSGAGSRSNYITRRGRWRVSGITPRKFSAEVKKRRRKPYTKSMNDAVERGVNKNKKAQR